MFACEILFKNGKIQGRRFLILVCKGILAILIVSVTENRFSLHTNEIIDRMSDEKKKKNCTPTFLERKGQVFCTEIKE